MRMQMCYTHSGSTLVLMEAKELRSDRDSELPVPAETGHSQHTCDTSSTGHQGELHE